MVVERRFRLDADISFANYARSQDYRLLGRKGEGTFSEVLKCQSLRDGVYYACKRLKQRYDSQESVNGLREVQAMRRLGSHPNIVQLHEVLYDKKSGTLALICELMDMNMYELIRDRRNFLPEGRIRSYMQQLCRSLDYMHRNGIFHRDVKPENILIKNEVLKLADFGSCKSAFARPPFTEYISTRWYRAPECLLTDGHYGLAMDMWSAGCVFYEITSLQPLFPGANEVDQISKIHEVLGTPTAALLNKMRSKSRGLGLEFPSQKGLGLSRLVPHASAEATQLMAAMLTYDPEERLSAKGALRHAFFTGVRSASQPAQIGDPERGPMGVYGPLSPLVLKEDPPAKAASLPWISAAKPVPRRQKRLQAQGGLAVPVSHPRGGGDPPESSFSSASAFHGLPLSRLRVGGVAPPLRLPPLPPLHASGSGIHLSTLQAQARKAEHAERLGIHYPLPSMARRGGKFH